MRSLMFGRSIAVIVALCLLGSASLVAPPRALAAGEASGLSIPTSDLYPDLTSGNQSDFRRTALTIVGTIAGAVIGYAIGGGIIGLAIGGVAAYFFSRLAAADMFPDYAATSYTQWRSNRTFQTSIVRPSDVGTPDTYADGHVGGSSTADLQALHDAYYASLEAYQDTLRTGTTTEMIGRSPARQV